MVGVRLAGEAGDDVGAEGEARAEAAEGRVAERGDVFARVGAVHAPEDAVRGGLEGEVQEAADVRMRGERVEEVRAAEPRLKRTEAEAVRRGAVERGEGGDEVGEAPPGVAVEGEIAARDDELAVAGGEEGARAREDVREGDGGGRAAKLRDDAERAASRAAVLHLQVGAGGRARDGGVRRRRRVARGAGQTARAADLGGGEARAEACDLLLALVRGLRGDGAAAHDDAVGRGVGVERHDRVARRAQARLLLQRLGMVEAAAERLEGDAHLARGQVGEEDEQEEVRRVEEEVRRHRGEHRAGAGVEQGEGDAEEPERGEGGGVDVDEREDGPGEDGGRPAGKGRGEAPEDDAPENRLLQKGGLEEDDDDEQGAEAERVVTVRKALDELLIGRLHARAPRDRARAEPVEPQGGRRQRGRGEGGEAHGAQAVGRGSGRRRAARKDLRREPEDEQEGREEGRREEQVPQQDVRRHHRAEAVDELLPEGGEPARKDERAQRRRGGEGVREAVGAVPHHLYRAGWASPSFVPRTLMWSSRSCCSVT